MSTEDVVSYSVMRYLIARRWHILQYHAPGGQAAIHFDLLDGTRVVPDVMGYRDATLLVIECKGRYAESDVDKLQAMQRDAPLHAKAIALADQHALRENLPPPNIREAIFAHAFLGTASRTPQCTIGLIAVLSDGTLSSALPIH